MAQAKNPHTTNPSRRRVLAGLSLAAAAVPAVVAVDNAPAGAQAGAGPDPIFAAIAKHRQALAAYDSALTARNDAERDDEAGSPALQLSVDSTDEAETEATNALIRTVPTTLAGALAAIEYVTGYYTGESELFPGRRHEVFDGTGGIVAFVKTIGTAIAAALPRAAA